MMHLNERIRTGDEDVKTGNGAEKNSNRYLLGARIRMKSGRERKCIYTKKASKNLPRHKIAS